MEEVGSIIQAVAAVVDVVACTMAMEMCLVGGHDDARQLPCRAVPQLTVSVVDAVSVPEFSYPASVVTGSRCIHGPRLH